MFLRTRIFPCIFIYFDLLGCFYNCKMNFKTCLLFIQTLTFDVFTTCFFFRIQFDYKTCFGLFLLSNLTNYSQQQTTIICSIILITTCFGLFHSEGFGFALFGLVVRRWGV
ncbi:unnamed protein product [Meloidogyne enterolobii]|uniref:Uncharacterized protein n=1 Tax=Meloidogyne enterolobii TaxID=390850 RepID=A0ACB1AEQ5_MELEN